MSNSPNAETESELRKIADYIVALRSEIAVLQANEIHLRKIPAAGQELAAPPDQRGGGEATAISLFALAQVVASDNSAICNVRKDAATSQ